MISNRVFDTNARLTAPQQLRHCACGHPMFGSRDDWYGLVYRCDTRYCGQHLAHIIDIEAELTATYRALRIRESYGLGPEAVRDKAFETLKLAWVKDGHVVRDAVRFNYYPPHRVAACGNLPKVGGVVLGPPCEITRRLPGDGLRTGTERSLHSP